MLILNISKDKVVSVSDKPELFKSNRLEIMIRSIFHYVSFVIKVINIFF